MQRKTLSAPSRAKGDPVSWIVRHLKAAIFSGILIPVVFFVFLSYYNILMYLSNYYTIFDLGLAYRTMYLFITTHSLVNWPVPHALVTAKPYTKLIYVPLSLTLLIYRGPTTVLVDMIAAVSAGGYAIFRIFKIRTSSTIVGLMAQAMYFLYPATYGLMAHGGNFMIYFTPFLLLSFMYYIEEKPYKSGIFALLAMLTFSFATMLVPLFYLVTIILDKRFYSKQRLNSDNEKVLKKPKNKVQLISSNLAFLVILFLLGTIILSFEFSMYTVGGLITAARLPVSGQGSASAVSGGSLLNAIFGTLPYMKANFFLNLLYPLLFLPILTPYSLFILPFFILVFYANYFPYYNVSQQYPSMISAILFIGMAHFLHKHLRWHAIRKIMVLSIVVSTISFLTLSPFSASDIESGYNFTISHVTNLDVELNKGLSLIPLNSSVFVQNDLPQLMDRANVYMPGYYSNQTVEYAVIVPSDIGFPSDQYSGYDIYWANHFALNISYGIYENIGGILVYKLHFTSSPVYTVLPHLN